MTKSLFVTATGTDIGKTYISALIVKKMIDYGFNCGYFKPVLSGAMINYSGKIIPGDCKYVIDFANLNIEPEKCLSYCFNEAVSPHLAAKLSKTIIEQTKIINDYEKFKHKYDYIVIEGAGGIACPLHNTLNGVYSIADLIKDMSQDVLIISDSGLGAINSTVTTVEYIKARGIIIKGIILNNFDKNNSLHCDNLYMIEKMTDCKIVAAIEKNRNDIDINKDLLISLFKEA